MASTCTGKTHSNGHSYLAALRCSEGGFSRPVTLKRYPEKPELAQRCIPWSPFQPFGWAGTVGKWHTFLEHPCTIGTAPSRFGLHWTWSTGLDSVLFMLLQVCPEASIWSQPKKLRRMEFPYPGNCSLVSPQMRGNLGKKLACGMVCWLQNNQQYSMFQMMTWYKVTGKIGKISNIPLARFWEQRLTQLKLESLWICNQEWDCISLSPQMLNMHTFFSLFEMTVTTVLPTITKH